MIDGKQMQDAPLPSTLVCIKTAQLCRALHTQGVALPAGDSCHRIPLFTSPSSGPWPIFPSININVKHFETLRPCALGKCFVVMLTFAQSHVGLFQLCRNHISMLLLHSGLLWLNQLCRAWRRSASVQWRDICALSPLCGAKSAAANRSRRKQQSRGNGWR